MLLFLDTEFTGLDQAKPDLISIGMVDEAGREFYAELPESHWTVQCNEWVHNNVLPHLWDGDYTKSESETRDALFNWISSIAEQTIIVTDYPEVDFYLHLWRLLPKWPKNLDIKPVQFSVWSLGDDKQAALQQVMDAYFNAEHPRHHALHDAHALRRCYQYAIENGWRQNEC
jgi:hypothetical protein